MKPSYGYFPLATSTIVMPRLHTSDLISYPSPFGARRSGWRRYFAERKWWWATRLNKNWNTTHRHIRSTTNIHRLSDRVLEITANSEIAEFHGSFSVQKNVWWLDIWSLQLLSPMFLTVDTSMNDVMRRFKMFQCADCLKLNFRALPLLRTHTATATAPSTCSGMITLTISWLSTYSLSNERSISSMHIQASPWRKLLKTIHHFTHLPHEMWFQSIWQFHHNYWLLSKLPPLAENFSLTCWTHRRVRCLSELFSVKTPFCLLLHEKLSLWRPFQGK